LFSGHQRSINLEWIDVVGARGDDQKCERNCQNLWAKSMDTFDDIKKQSEDLFRSTSSQPSSETTPPEITPEVRAFAAQLSNEPPNRVPVRNDKFGVYGWCSNGVLEKIKHDGGSIVFGWTIWEWPGVLLTGEFHAVWMDAKNNFYDITPKPHGETEIIFVPDRNYGSDFDFDRRPLNRRYQLYKRPDVSGAVSSKLAAMKPKQRECETKRATKAGMSLEEWMLRKQPPDRKDVLIRQFIEVCDAHGREIDTLHPGSGFVEASPKLIELEQRKRRLLDELHRL
jgi:hypothetical protein